MKPKTIITILLLVFVLGSVVFLIAGESLKKGETPATTTKEKPVANDGPSPAQQRENTKKTSPQSSRKIIAYYFHGRARCRSCILIESYTKEAIYRDFENELKSGHLEWRPVNVEEAGNKHFIQDYKLYTKSVIIADVQDNRQMRWKNLEKVWELLYEKEVFFNYISDEIKAYL